ncbi:MAG: hypothetical protein KC619_03945 [Myxococcales bacterium]|nr:hypothetical protein [Myxococcales bacterium]
MPTVASIKALTCPHCTAPLHPEGGKSAVCPYCGHLLVDLPATWWARPVPVPPWEGRPEDRGKRRVGLGKHRWVLDTKIGKGDHADVWRAHRDARLTREVVIKIARDADGSAAKAITAEHRALERLTASGAEGADHFARLLPEPVAVGKLRGDGPALPAAAYGVPPGFVHDLTKVRARYPKGVDPRVAVWMWKRLLEMLSWVHASGFVHGDVRPEHSIVHPTAHGVMLVGWTAAAWRHGRDGRSPALDLSASARVFAYVLGGDGGRLSRAVPGTLARLAEATSDPKKAGEDGWRIHGELVRLAYDQFGPAAYVPLSLDPEG